MMIYYICFFFFNDTATTEIYTLSLHDALPILEPAAAAPLYRHRHRRRPCRPDADAAGAGRAVYSGGAGNPADTGRRQDRKSTRLNSSHANISYAVFCLKKKKNNNKQYNHTYRK